MPEELREQFRFEPGQHVTVRTDLGGEGVRRNYSICAPATRAMLRIAVKHIPGGAFSTFVAEQLKAGDVLEVMTPTGRFCPPLDPLHRKHYVAIVVGSGITPILSMLQTTLELETDSRFTLIYGNRTKESTMFRSELDELESRYATGSRSCTSSPATRSTLPCCAAGSTATSSSDGWPTSWRPRRSTSGSCAARSS